MLKKTGPGKIATSAAVPVGGARASLFNFDVDGYDIKPEHIHYLNSTVAPILVGSTARCWLQGSASRAGTAAHNMKLSQNRVETIAAHLRARGVGAHQIHPTQVGATMGD